MIFISSIDWIFHLMLPEFVSEGTWFRRWCQQRLCGVTAANGIIAGPTTAGATTTGWFCRAIHLAQSIVHPRCQRDTWVREWLGHYVNLGEGVGAWLLQKMTEETAGAVLFVCSAFLDSMFKSVDNSHNQQTKGVNSTQLMSCITRDTQQQQRPELPAKNCFLAYK